VLSKRLDWLYHGPLEEFTPRRNALVDDLRSGGKQEAARWVKGLRKPTRAAWLVNQLAAKSGRAVRQLLKASAELRAAQEEMLAGSTDQRKLRRSATKERKAIDALSASAEKLGEREGVGQQVMARVSETLQAAASDPEVAEAVELGRLDREQRAASLGLVGTASPAPATGRKGKDAESERRARQQQAKRRKAAERKLTVAEKKLEREQGRLEKAEQAVEEAERRVHDAELDANAARRALAEL
jgi:chromosome segregation ATPase